MWMIIFGLILASSSCFGQSNCLNILDGALFTGLFLLLIRLRHTFGVGSSIIIPSALVACFTLYRMSYGGIQYSNVLPFACFVRYCTTSLIFLIALAISGKRTFLVRAYNGLVMGATIFVFSSLFMFWFSGIHYGEFVNFAGGQALLGGAMGLYLMVATQSANY
jgi:hypothetical protein